MGGRRALTLVAGHSSRDGAKMYCVLRHVGDEVLELDAVALR